MITLHLILSDDRFTPGNLIWSDSLDEVTVMIIYISSFYIYSDIKYEVSYALMKWVYTDSIDIKTDELFLLELLRTATRFKLKVLQERYLINSCNSNCYCQGMFKPLA